MLMTSLEVAEVIIDYLEAKRCSDGTHTMPMICVAIVHHLAAKAPQGV
jgi:hypothetical protein